MCLLSVHHRTPYSTQPLHATFYGEPVRGFRERKIWKTKCIRAVTKSSQSQFRCPEPTGTSTRLHNPHAPWMPPVIARSSWVSADASSVLMPCCGWFTPWLTQPFGAIVIAPRRTDAQKGEWPFSFFGTTIMIDCTPLPLTVLFFANATGANEKGVRNAK